VFVSITGFLQDSGAGAWATIFLFLALLSSCNVDVTITGEGSGRVVDTNQSGIDCTITNGVATKTGRSEPGCVFRVRGDITLKATPATGFGIDSWIVKPKSEIEGGCGVGESLCIFTTDDDDVEVKIIFSDFSNI
jgi:hypothetical protein